MTTRIWHCIGLGFALVVPLASIGVKRADAQAGVEAVSPPPIFEEQPVGKPPPPSQVEPITDVVPLWGKGLREKGTDLPLPFGLGVTYTYIRQNTRVYDVQVQGNPLGVTIPDADTYSNTAVLRADVWILPVLNVYGVIAYTGGTTKPAISLPNGTTIDSRVTYDRAAYGGGATLAGGYKAYFLTLDSNYTTGAIQTKKGQLGDRALYSLTFTPRFGTNFSSGFFGQGALWIGGMYMDFAQEVRGTVDLADRGPVLPIIVGQDDISYRVRIKAKNPWNLLIGGNWQINKRWSLTAEVGGVLDRLHALGALMFRF